ncbi:MAG: transposase [Methylobacter sp.]
MNTITEVLTGIVSRVTYHNPATVWSVLRVQPFQSPQQQETVTVHQTKVFAGATRKHHYYPAMLLALLFYGYATGVFSSRKLENATYDSMAFKFICANENPDHDTINSFRKRFNKEIEGLFVEILVLAGALGLLKLGTVSLDGTKIKANACKHKALSWDYANQLETQFKQEIAILMKLAEAAERTPLPEDMEVPKELKRRQDRLAVKELSIFYTASVGIFSPLRQ